MAVSALAATLIFAAASEARPQPQARLSPAIAYPEAGPVAGKPYEVVGDVTNKGRRARRATVRASLTADGHTIDLGTDRTRRIRPKHAREFAIRGSVPVSLQAGGYKLSACVRKRGNRGPKECARVDVVATAPSDTDPTVPPPPPDFKAGARTLNDPLLPQIGNGGYDAANYAIDLEYDPTANEFTGAATTMTARATQDLSEFSLDFQDLPVDRVLVNGTAAQFSQVAATPALAGGGTQPRKLAITPAAGITNGSSFTVEVDYHGQPQEFVDPDGSPEGWITNAGGSSFVVGEPMGSQAWFPSNNHPSDKATFETSVTVPTGNTALGVGELDSQTPNGDGTTTWDWSEDDPTSTYLVTASVAATPLPLQFTQSTITEALTGRTLPIYDTIATSAFPVRAGIVALTSQNQSMIDILGAHYGPYPLDSYGSFWDQNPSIGYELEVQTKSHFSTAPVPASTYVHELSHQWWGDSVTLHDWNDVWHNEGWAQLSEWIWGNDSGTDLTTPEQHFDNSYSGASASDWLIPPATLDGDPANMFASFPTYERPGMMLEGFREILIKRLGPTAFDDFARAEQFERAHGNIDTDGFIRYAEVKSGFTGADLALLHSYFQQWLYGTTKPAITPDNF